MQRSRRHGHFSHQARAPGRSARPVRPRRAAVRGLPRARRCARRCDGRYHRRSSLSAPSPTRPSQQQNANCLGCHQSNAAHDWASSAHAASDVACASCHQLHAAKDPVQTAAGQIEVCTGCHQAQHADLDKLSHHPLREGKMACTSCHSPHGSTAPAQLVKNTVNETCTSCHAEYRGPFLWEHQPVAEDCTNCHNPHGSAQPALLKLRPPFLCQTCHEGAGHPSIAQHTARLGGRRRPERVSARRRLHQLSFADSRLEPSVGPRVHAIGAHHETLIRSNLARLRCGIRGIRFVDRAWPMTRPSADTSDWKCTQCPFAQGYSGDAEARRARRQRRERDLRALYGHRSRRRVRRCRGLRAVSQRRWLLRELRARAPGARLARRLCRGRTRRALRSARELRRPAEYSLRHRRNAVPGEWLDTWDCRRAGCRRAAPPA